MPVKKQGHLSVLHLEGSPEDMGEEHGRCCCQDIGLFLERFLGRCERFIGLPYKVLLEGAHTCGESVPDVYLREMKALARVVGVRFEEVLALNCLPDVDEYHMKQLFQCCNIVVKSSDGRFFAHGRNLDFPVHEADNKMATLVVVRHPSDSGALSTLSVSWCGFVGTYTGCNDHGLSMGHVSAPTRAAHLGVPLALQMRALLEHATSLGEAEWFALRNLPSHAVNIAIANGASQEALALECTPTQCSARSAKEGWLVVDNLCLTEDAASNRLSYASGVIRYARAVQLLKGLRGGYTRQALLEILRDQYDLTVGETRDSSFRQCFTICNFMTAQSALFLHSEGCLLVSTGAIPAPLGDYEELNLREAFSHLNTVKEEAAPEAV